MSVWNFSLVARNNSNEYVLETLINKKLHSKTQMVLGLTERLIWWYEIM